MAPWPVHSRTLLSGFLTAQKRSWPQRAAAPAVCRPRPCRPGVGRARARAAGRIRRAIIQSAAPCAPPRGPRFCAKRRCQAAWRCWTDRCRVMRLRTPGLLTPPGHWTTSCGTLLRWCVPWREAPRGFLRLVGVWFALCGSGASPQSPFCCAPRRHVWHALGPSWRGQVPPPWRRVSLSVPPFATFSGCRRYHFPAVR